MDELSSNASDDDIFNLKEMAEVSNNVKHHNQSASKYRKKPQRDFLDINQKFKLGKEIGKLGSNHERTIYSNENTSTKNNMSAADTKVSERSFNEQLKRLQYNRFIKLRGLNDLQSTYTVIV